MRTRAMATAVAWLAGCATPPAAAPPDNGPLVPVTAAAAEALRPEDRAAAAAAERAALEEGRAVGWSGSGISGLITPRPAWAEDGRRCRAYSHSVRTATVTREWRAAACRDRAGHWRMSTGDRPDAR
ncbi:MAG: hypothetical protein AB1918_09665 [Pseudomonadota bacterium]